MRRELPMILIRGIVGLMFLLEGFLKFAIPSEFGAGRFAELGLPSPDLLAPFVGGIEMLGGAAMLFNLFAGDAALALLLVILTALATTKMPILLGHRFGPFPLPPLAHYGWLSFLHESRAEICVTFVLIAVLIDSGVRMGRRRQWYQGE
jgi:putative oxidoreductase